MSAQDELLSQCNKDIEYVQRELDANLTRLAEDVDQGFGQLRAINKQCMDFAEQLQNSGFGKAATVASWAGLAISGLGGAFSAAQAASKHNEALDRMMQQKVKIANEKFDKISSIQKIAERCNESLFKVLSHELVQEYKERDLVANHATTNGIINEIHRIEEAFKIANYNLMMVEFLLDEYKAWMNHQQKSGTSRPVMSFVNNDITDWMFDCNDGLGLNLQSVISRKGCRGKVTGAELLFLTDSSITACGLWGQMSNGDEVREIGVEPGGIAKKLIEKNSAYQKYLSSLSEYNGWWHAPALAALVIVGLSVGFDVLCWGWMSEWWAFFRWVVMIILVLIEYGILSASCPTLFDDGKRRERLNEICNKAQDEQLIEMGYVEIYEPDYEKKSVVAEGVKGFFEGIFG